MTAQRLYTADLTADEREKFPREVAFLRTRMNVRGTLSARFMADLLVIYRRLDGSLGELERLLIPDDKLLLEDWLQVVFRSGNTPLPDIRLHACGLVHLGAAGLETETLADLAAAWAALPGYLEPDGDFFRAPLNAVHRYVAYLLDFASYLDARQNRIARKLCLQHLETFNADTVAAFVGNILPAIEARCRTEAPEFRASEMHLVAWFDLFRAHDEHAPDLPADYLNTPMLKVVRNVLPQIWIDLPDCEQQCPWVFALGEPGYYHLAAGKSVRNFLRQAGITRATWRAFAKLPATTSLVDLNRPAVYLWALGLGANEHLARELPAFLPPGGEQCWEYTVRQMTRMEVYWLEDSGQRLLGYIHHLLRDQPDFKVNARRTAALLTAANEHYVQIQQTREVIRLRRIAEREAMDFTDVAEQERLEREYRRAYHARVAKLQAEKWTPCAIAKPYREPDSKLRIVEITNSWELHLEGQRMQHCVGSYSHYCLTGQDAIFSLRYDADGVVRSIATICLDIEDRIISEARGRFNRIPNGHYRAFINRWAKRNGIAPLKGWG